MKIVCQQTILMKCYALFVILENKLPNLKSFSAVNLGGALKVKCSMPNTQTTFLGHK